MPVLIDGEIAGPGFMNFRLDPVAIALGVRDILIANHAYGTSRHGAGTPVVVEFVSANPTGPLHVGHGRQAALGDTIATLLERTGWAVSREFYYNDAGVQIDNLAKRRRTAECAEIAAVQIPEGITANTLKIAARYDQSTSVREFAVQVLRAEQDLDLKAFGVR